MALDCTSDSERVVKPPSLLLLNVLQSQLQQLVEVPCTTPDDDDSVSDLFSGPFLPGQGYTNKDYEKNGAEGPGLDLVGNGTVSLSGHPSVKSKTGRWKATFFVHALIFADIFSAPGLSANMEPFLFGKLHLSIAQSSSIVYNFMGVAYLLPIFWGYLADTYFGKYYTIVLSSIICTAGWVIFLLSFNLMSLQPPSCTPTLLNPICPRASQQTLTWFSGGLFMIAIGSAGLKPCMIIMAMDQFDETDPVEKKGGELFFSTFYANLNFTAVFVVTFLVYLQSNVGYSWGWGVEGCLFLLGAVFFFSGTQFLRHRKPAGSAFTRLAQVLVVAVRTAKKPVPSNASELYEIHEFYSNNNLVAKIGHTDRLRFLDKAAIKPGPWGDEQKAPGPWKLCTLTQVEELKSILQILPIWLTTIIGVTLYSQTTGVTLQQASSLDRKLGSHFTVPAASTVIFLLISSLLFIPTWDFIIAPSLGKLTGHPRGLSELQCMGLGHFLTIVSMIVAAQVEHKRVNTIKNNHISYPEIIGGGVPLSIFWLLPQYAILGVSDTLLGVNQLKFFYAETPEHMKSIAASLYYFSVSFGYFTSSILVNTVNKYTKSSGGWLGGAFDRGGLENYYYLLAIIMAVNLIAFIGIARCFTQTKPVQPENMLDCPENSLKL